MLRQKAVIGRLMAEESTEVGIGPKMSHGLRDFMEPIAIHEGREPPGDDFAEARRDRCGLGGLRDGRLGMERPIR